MNLYRARYLLTLESINKIQTWWKTIYYKHYYTCPVCFEKGKNFVQTYNCSHKFCDNCSERWNTSCPTCRASPTNRPSLITNNSHDDLVSRQLLINFARTYLENNTNIINTNTNNNTISRDINNTRYYHNDLGRNQINTYTFMTPPGSNQTSSSFLNLLGF